MTDFVTEFLKDEDAPALAKAFLQIRAPIVRRSIVRTVKVVGDDAMNAQSQFGELLLDRTWRTLCG
jgi:hypothetical protein